MNCERWQPLLTAAAFDDLPADERAALAAHTAGCSACAASLAALKEWKARAPKTRALPDADFFIRQRSAIMARLPAQASGARSWRAKTLWVPAAALGLFATLWFSRAKPPVDDLVRTDTLEMVQNMELVEHLELMEDWEDLDNSLERA